MKLHILALTLASALGAAAVGVQGLPPCAKECATGSLPQSCGHVDIKCICTDKSFITDISCCVKTACPPADQQKALQFAENICKLAGVAGSLPKSASCASGAAGGTPTETASTNAASTNAASTNAAATSTEATSAAATGTAATGSAPTHAATTGSAASGGSGPATPTATPAKGTAAALGQSKEVALAAAVGAAAFAIFA